jgi:hypothetical protein
MKNKSKNIIALAVSGLVAGSLMASNAFAGDDTEAGHGEHADKESCKGGEKDSCKGEEKDSCKGHEKSEKDSCKGKEGCGAKE